MNIKQKYENLANKVLDKNNYENIVLLRNECILQNNYEYYYLCNILIIDYFIEQGNLNDALEISLKIYDEIDSIIFKKSYMLIIERLIYIYINKQNFSCAYRFANEKRTLINYEDKKAVNRWYLEMSYIHEALNEINKSMTDLTCILENEPDLDMRIICLSNLCKIFIDQNKIEQAKERLSECLSLMNKNTKDKEGLIYCDYLNALIFIKEKKYKYALKLFIDIFKSKFVFTESYLDYLNEYMNLLFTIEDYSEVKKIALKYKDEVDKINNNKNKKIFYTIYLKSIVYLSNVKKDEITYLNDIISNLDKQIKENEYYLINDLRNDEIIYEVNNNSKKIYTNLNNLITNLNYSFDYDNEHKLILDFTKNLNKIVSFNEAFYVIFDHVKLDLLPEFYDDFYKVSTYSYKKERLFPRKIEYNDLNNTIIELLVRGDKEVCIDFTETKIEVNEVISKVSYIDLKTKYLCAFSLYFEEKLFACIVFTSSNYNILEQDSYTILKLASKMFEPHLTDCSYKESIKYKQKILDKAMLGLQEGIFFFDVNHNRVILTEQFQNFISTKDHEIRKEELNNIIEDSTIYDLRNNYISKKEEYNIEYYILVNTKKILVCERGTPYYNSKNELLFYICTINKITISKTIEEINKNDKIYTLHDLLENITKENSYYIESYLINISNDNNETKINIIKELYSLLKNVYKCDIYLVDNKFEVLLNNINKSIIEEKYIEFTNDLSKGILIDGELINCDYKRLILKCPEDINNINEVLNFQDYVFSQNKVNNYFSNDVFKSYLFRNSVIECVDDCLKDSQLQLLYNPLLINDELYSYLLSYNVKGIAQDINIMEYLDSKRKISFEKLMIKKLENSYSHDEPIFIYLSIETLQNLIRNKYKFKIRNLYICIDQNDNSLENILEYFSLQNIKFYFKQTIFNKLSIELIYSGYVKGYIGNDIYEHLKPLILNNNLFILSDKKIDYKNIIIKSKHYLTINDLNK